jgi:peptide/nickel transport system substrate-binding protein
MQSKDLNRRDFLKWTAMATASLAMASCAKPTEAPVVVEPTKAPTAAPAKATDTPVPTSKYTEAPMLAEKVKTGELPPVEERLPVNPCVFPLMEGVGKHGGVMRRGFNGVSDRWGPTKCKDHGLVWFDKDLNQWPRACESWEVNADGSKWTWNLREGMKWSDGMPFTSGDFRWYFENDQLNEELQTSVNARWSSGSPKVWMTIETPDDYTLTMNFANPKPLLILELGRENECFTPGHYMKQFHIDLCDDKAALEAEY